VGGNYAAKTCWGSVDLEGVAPIVIYGVENVMRLGEERERDLDVVE